jgi:hypothetical protein
MLRSGFFNHLVEFEHTIKGGIFKRTLPCSNESNVEHSGWNLSEQSKIVAANNTKIYTHAAITDIPTISYSCYNVSHPSSDVCHLKEIPDAESLAKNSLQEPRQ